MRRPVARLTAAAALLAVAAPAGAAGGGGGGDSAVVPLGKFRVPIIDAGRMDGDLELELAVTPGEGGDAAALGAAQPALRAAMLSALLDFAQLRASPRVAVDAEALATLLDNAAHAADPQAGHVLILEVKTRAARGAP
ncbi:hypothetical protein J2Y54_003025 [Sphingomonas sp. BE123]|uniref:hypothetical protein n=1 Tax=Sphingomonas sp. BE123 TaxID=2817842 RepID=UPI002867583B|nr:hypothetical protein [Sphingomonas sp. BE123]MDR6853505.1 hypothetical protein [Sphingomonas sp. BE123]